MKKILKSEKKKATRMSKNKKDGYERYYDTTIRGEIIRRYLKTIIKIFCSEYLKTKKIEQACRNLKLSNVIKDGLSFVEYLYLKDTSKEFNSTFNRIKSELTDSVIEDSSASGADPYLSLKNKTKMKELDILSKGGYNGGNIIIQINEIAEIEKSAGTKKQLTNLN